MYKDNYRTYRQYEHEQAGISVSSFLFYAVGLILMLTKVTFLSGYS